MSIQGTIKMRTGLEADFDPDKMIAGEWAVSTDAKYVRMCFAPGVIIRMATYEAFEADMGEIRDILLEAKTVQEAVQIIQSEINDSEIVVEQYATMSKSYAVGGTGSREEEDTDNAKYYYDQAKRIAQGVNGIVPMGTITFEELPTEDIVNNAMYNISNAFTSDERFNDGGGVFYGAGNNVLWTGTGKWDVAASSGVTGIKGANESVYRQGNVNISAENIGLGNVDNTSDMNKPISNAQRERFEAIDGKIGDDDISGIGNGTVKGAIVDLEEKKANADNYLPLTGGTLSGNVEIKKASNPLINLIGETVGHKGAMEMGRTGILWLDNLIMSSGSGASVFIKPLENTAIYDLLGLTVRKSNGTTNYRIFGEHNKPKGSYTGNGSATSRQVSIGGIGELLYISGYGNNAIVGSQGGVWWNAAGQTGATKGGEVTFANGILYLSNISSAYNASGAVYGYQVL